MSILADSDTIVIIEQILKIKIIIMSSYNYLQGDLGAVLQCGDMVPEIVEKNNILNQNITYWLNIQEIIIN